MAVQSTTLPVFWASLLAFIQNTGIFGPDSVDFAVDAEAMPDGMFPAGPPPFCLIEPGAFDNHGENVGGGRFAKTWTVEWTLAIFVRNITDQSYRSTAAVTSADLTIGIYAIADACINLLEQGYVIDTNGNLQFVELPVAGKIGKPRRLNKSNEYLMIDIPFTGVIDHGIPADLP